MSMDSELSESQISPTPKLSLFSLPLHTPDPPPESLTPPFQTPASVPFKWEEAPGKPLRNFTGALAKPRVARCLDLPPSKITNTPSPQPSFRKVMKGDCEITNTPSPSSVLDGPKVSKTVSFSFRKLLKGEGKITNLPSLDSILDGPGSGPGLNISKTMSLSFRKMIIGEGVEMTNTPSPSLTLDKSSPGPDLELGPDPHTISSSFRDPEEGLVWKLIDKEKANFSSLRWEGEKGFEKESEGNLDFSSPFGCIRKRSGFWASFYKNVKEAVAWKRRHDKRRKTNV